MGCYISDMSRRNLDQLAEDTGCIANFIRQHRKKLGYTQTELAQRTGVGLRFLKELELGKKTLRLDKVEQVLQYFGYTLTPTPIERSTNHHESR